ncbi:membrane protein [Oceanicola sp. 22II-s10i]|uniref:DMT family transporter n=1 Tax=Oceanicola sp. 22II-s10i TaxID=1317116 RepID=UPI000B52777C|nr:DMT family transporter [Oceanicola sp. 22II-s10i]OWU82888.1 membrane protein [Oceanicola sp. 22II-s10i]
METWVLFTFGAVVFQTLRFMVQKQLSTSSLSASGATFARFIYSAPLVLAAVPFLLNIYGLDWPHFSLTFWLYAWVGGITQIFATVFVLLIFRSRHFAVGVTLKKTEVLLTAIVSLAVLGEGVSLPALVAIMVGLAGVLLLSDLPGGDAPLWRRIGNRAAVLGIGSGVLFALSGVCYRGATLEIAADEPLVRAVVTLAAVGMSQLIGMGLWLRLREPGEIGRVVGAWRTAGLVGLTSLFGSVCWFTAFTLQNATYVYAVGQSEVILSLMAGYLFFRERLSSREIVGIGLITASVLSLILLV